MNKLILSLGGVLLFALATCAQNYSIDWYTIDGGGGTSSGGNYSISGTIGQPDAGVLTNGNFSVSGGFWSLVQVVQTPDAPLLSVQNLGGPVRVFWPANAGNFVLEQSGALPGAWATVGLPYATNGTAISVTVTNPVGNLFFRLRAP
jgi:hypothetical protein